MHDIIQNPIFSVAIIVVIIGFLMYRQIHPRKLNQKSLIVFPAIILFFIIQSFGTFHPTQSKLLEILISSIISIILGLLACRQLRVYKGPSGKAMTKGSWMYFLWWLATFIIKSGLSVLFKESSFNATNQTEIFLPIFFLIVTRNAYLYWKTKKLGLELH